MTSREITGATVVAGVVGCPIDHSLSPVIHNGWLGATGVDGVYIPFSPEPGRFERFVDGLRAGALTGLNVTAPFKQRAVELADDVDPAADAAGAANLLVFRKDGSIEARNTDGIGLLAAFAEQAPGWRAAAGPVVVLGAGGAARGAVAALLAAGATVRLVNRTMDRASEIADRFDGVTAQTLAGLGSALEGATTLINAAPLDPTTVADVAKRLRELPPDRVVMDMIYTPVETELLAQARVNGLRCVDGLAMLIGQARPSFEALFGVPVPVDVNVRALAETALRTRL